MNKISILVATHKKYNFPKDELYIPIHVGSKGKKDLGYMGDNSGENISDKNDSYCELTGLYWAWKNYECDYIGLCHYRRYFELNKKILEEKDIQALMSEKDVVLPYPRKLYRRTIKEDFSVAHFEKDLNMCRNSIVKLSPEYVEYFDEFMSNNKLCAYNMFIMSKENFDSYCKWLFEILFDVEKNIDITDYSKYQKRIYGFLSERLLNIWVMKNILQEKIGYIGVVNIENDCGAMRKRLNSIYEWLDGTFKFKKEKM